MQNVEVWSPGIHTHVLTYSNGNAVVTNSSASSFTRTRYQSGYTGTRSKSSPPPIHPYSLTAQEMSLTTTSSYRFKSDGRTETTSGSALWPGVWGVTFSPTYDFGPLYNRALEQLTERVRGGLDVSIDLIQARQTAKMLDSQQRVVDYTRAFTRRFGLARLISSHYLEYIYGVKPLVQTVFGAADELLRYNLHKYERVSGRASNVYRPTHALFKRHNSETLSVPVTSCDMKISTTVGVNLSVSNGFQLERWTSMNPVSIAWEILPYSFVVDWFINVGGYLRSLETSLLYANRFVAGYRTNLLTGRLTARYYSSADTSVNVGFSEFNGYNRTVSISRSALSSYPVPTLPSFDVKLGSSRLLAGAALLAQLLGRRS